MPNQDHVGVPKAYVGVTVDPAGTSTEPTPLAGSTRATFPATEIVVAAAPAVTYTMQSCCAVPAGMVAATVVAGMAGCETLFPLGWYG